MNLVHNKDPISMNEYGTEPSATSPFMPKSKINLKSSNMMGGGWLFSDDENSLKALKACKEKEFAAFSFLIRNDMVSDFTVVDQETGCSILHCVAKHYFDIPSVSLVLNKLFSCSYVEDFINLKDNNGDTPL